MSPITPDNKTINYTLWGKDIKLIKVSSNNSNSFTYGSGVLSYSSNLDTLEFFKFYLYGQTVDYLKIYLSENDNFIKEKFPFPIQFVVSKRNTKTFSGSCMRKKGTPVTYTISISPIMAAFDVKYFDYLMKHELTHTRYYDHSPSFHQYLESICPGSKELKKQLDNEYRKYYPN
jgi:predicted metal-dependent hydrolase